MILLRRPSDARIGRFLEYQRSLPFTYPEVGASREGVPPGDPVNQLRGRLGAGPETFARAVEALRGWKMYETGWTKLCRPEAPITEGAVVGVLSRDFGDVVAQRLSDCLSDRGEGGFATESLRVRLRHVAWSRGAGEECFSVEWHRSEESVLYEVFAFARAANPLVKLGPPFVRLIQRRFAASSLRVGAAVHHGTFQFPRGCRTPFREPLQFIVIGVMSAMSGTFPIPMGFLRDGESLACPGTVTSSSW